MINSLLIALRKESPNMILESLWSKKCCRLTLRSEALLQAITILQMPILALYHAQEGANDISVYFSRDLILPDLCLADLLADEIGIAPSERAAVVVFGPNAQLGLGGGFALVAEVLYAAILRGNVTAEMSLFDWALRSFALKNKINSRCCDLILADFWGLPHAGNVLKSYIWLRQIDPQFERRKADAGLAEKLARSASLDAWLNILQTAYLNADCILMDQE